MKGRRRLRESNRVKAGERGKGRMGIKGGEGVQEEGGDGW